MNQQQMHGMPQNVGPMGMVGGSAGNMGMPQLQQQSPQQMMHHHPMQHNMMGGQPGMMMAAGGGQQEKFDNISKIKSLIVPLRESLSTTIHVATQILQDNILADNGTLKGLDCNNSPPRFDKNLEEFYSICDQIELNLKTSIQCLEQNASTQRYLPAPVATTRIEPIPLSDNGPISYPQFLSTVRNHISFANDLMEKIINPSDGPPPSSSSQSQNYNNNQQS